jgi:signal transduction histidine kinase
VTAALLNVEKHESMREESQRDLGQESARMVNLADELTAKTAELNDARRQMDEMKDYIRDMHRQLDGLPKQEEVSREQIALLAAEIDRLREEADQVDDLRQQLDSAVSELEHLREANERLLQTSAQSTDTAVSQLQAENLRLRQEAERISSLEREIEQLKLRPANMSAGEQVTYDRQWEDARVAAQAEIASLRARLAQATISQQEVGFLQEQLAIKARETIGLQTRLTEAQAVADALREQVAGGVNSTRELEVMQGRVAQQAAQIASLKTQLIEFEAGNLDADALRAGAALDQADREAMALLEAQLRDRGMLVDALEQQLSEKARAITELKVYMADVEESLRHLEQQFSHKDEEVERLQFSLADARLQAQERIAALEESRTTGENIDRAHMAALEAELAEKSAAVDLLERQLENARQSMGALEQQLTETRHAVDNAIEGARQVDSHDEVIASIAQELRTPMSSIMGYTDLLLRESIGILGSLQRKFLQRVKANTERMGALLDDLIRITALDTGRMELEPERVDVTYAIEEAVMNVANQYREKGLTLRMALAENMPPLTADRDALLQVIGHLLSNAALASPVEGEVQLTVTARDDELPVNGTSVHTRCLYVAVQDSGSGIAQADFERVFARKYRADNPLIEGLGDTGVSLSLAKALIDAHGGHIWLDSARDGTTFHVLLPLEPVHAEG